MIIEDIFTINRGVLVVGKPNKELFKLNDKVKIKGNNFEKEATIVGLDIHPGCFGEFSLESVTMGLLLEGIDEKEIKKGYCLVKKSD